MSQHYALSSYARICALLNYDDDMTAYYIVYHIVQCIVHDNIHVAQHYTTYNISQYIAICIVWQYVQYSNTCVCVYIYIYIYIYIMYDVQMCHITIVIVQHITSPARRRAARDYRSVRPRACNAMWTHNGLQHITYQHVYCNGGSFIGDEAIDFQKLNGCRANKTKHTFLNSRTLIKGFLANEAPHQSR